MSRNNRLGLSNFISKFLIFFTLKQSKEILNIVCLSFPIQQKLLKLCFGISQCIYISLKVLRAKPNLKIPYLIYFRTFQRNPEHRFLSLAIRLKLLKLYLVETTSQDKVESKSSGGVGVVSKLAIL